MKSSLLRILALTAMASAMPGLANAADLGGQQANIFGAPRTAFSWTGLYLGGTIGYGNANHQITHTTTWKEYTLPGTPAMGAYCDPGYDSCGGDEHYHPSVAAGPDIVIPAGSEQNGMDGLNAHGMLGGVTVGADQQIGRFVFGVMGDYDFNTMKYRETWTSGTDTGTGNSIKHGDSWTLTARLGYLVGDRTLVYALAGYGQADVTYTGGDNDMKKKVTFGGAVLGGGVDYALTQNIVLGVKYTHFLGGTETIFTTVDGPYTSVIQDKLDTDTVKASLTYRFGMGRD